MPSAAAAWLILLKRRIVLTSETLAPPCSILCASYTSVVQSVLGPLSGGSSRCLFVCFEYNLNWRICRARQPELCLAPCVRKVLKEHVVLGFPTKARVAMTFTAPLQVTKVGREPLHGRPQLHKQQEVTKVKSCSCSSRSPASAKGGWEGRKLKVQPSNMGAHVVLGFPTKARVAMTFTAPLQVTKVGREPLYGRPQLHKQQEVTKVKSCSCSQLAKPRFRKGRVGGPKA